MTDQDFIKQLQGILLNAQRYDGVGDILNLRNIENDKLRKDLQAQHKEIKDLRNTLRRANDCLNFYRSDPDTTHIDTCPQCEGAGGFTWETPDGGAGEECNVCQGSGHITGTWHELFGDNPTPTPVERKPEDDESPF